MEVHGNITCAAVSQFFSICASFTEFFNPCAPKAPRVTANAPDKQPTLNQNITQCATKVNLNSMIHSTKVTKHLAKLDPKLGNLPKNHSTHAWHVELLPFIS